MNTAHISISTHSPPDGNRPRSFEKNVVIASHLGIGRSGISSRLRTGTATAN